MVPSMKKFALMELVPDVEGYTGWTSPRPLGRFIHFPDRQGLLEPPIGGNGLLSDTVGPDARQATLRTLALKRRLILF